MSGIIKHKVLPGDPAEFRGQYDAWLKDMWRKCVSISGTRRKGMAQRRPSEQPGALARLNGTLQAMASRAEVLNPQGRGLELAQGFRASIEQLHTDAWLQERNQLLAAARQGDLEAQRMHAEIVKQSVQNWIFATSSWMNFFDVMTLQHNEQPYIECSVPQEINVGAIGPDGVPQNVRPIKRSEQALITLTRLATDRYVYPTQDLYKGFDVRDEALAQVDLVRDLNAAFDTILKQLLLVGSPTTRLNATFTTTGDPCDRHYYAHSAVQTANFPTGNYKTLASNSGTSEFRQECLEVIIDYVNSWGSNAFTDGPLRVEEIIIPSGHASGWLSQVQISNLNGSGGTSANSGTEQILQEGGVFEFGGQRFNYTYDNTLDPSAGVAYVRLSKKVGTVFTKPSLDEVITDNSFEMRADGKEAVAMTRVYGTGYATNQVPNMFAVKYRT